MKSFTPQISWHNRDPILSVDVQNRPISSSEGVISYRMATSGNDSHVIIWKTIIDQNIKTNNNNKSSNVLIECLADLTRHQRSVNVVRFSPKAEDNYLAAGDDDCVIYIWKLIKDNNDSDFKSPEKPLNNGKEFCVKNKDNSDEDDCEMIEVEGSQPFVVKVHLNRTDGQSLESEVIAKEVWKPYKILRGHLQDVSDICWSPDGQKILSGSVDNMVYVWDLHKGQKLVKIVNEHKGFVQGVAWDPCDKYLATLSADRNMRIIDSNSGRTVYRVHKLSLEDGKTTRLFYDDTLRSFCRRLTFSPGGEFLIAPSGIMELNEDNDNEDSNKYINTTYIFERNSLKKPSFYLPSKKYTIAVSCCPQLFRLQENLENHFQYPYRIVFAVATQDSVLFYDTQQALPFAQVSQIHYLRLTDISWSPDGRMLIVTSTDGFATFITFEANEIGVPYDGPKFNFEEMESNSPVSSAKNSSKLNITVESTPEADKQIKKVLTPSITTFFKPSNEMPTNASANDVLQNNSKTSTIDAKKIESNILSPESRTLGVPKVELMTPEIEKPIKKGSIKSFFRPKSETPNSLSVTKDKLEEKSISKKRKEVVVDLTEDSEDMDTSNHSSKKPNFSRSPLRNVNHANQETAAISSLVAPANYKVKEHSVRKLVDQIEEVSMDESSNMNVDHVNETNNEVKANTFSTETNNETEFETSTNLALQPISSSQTKPPRRIQFTTIDKN